MLSKRPPKLKPWLAYLTVPSSACSYPALSPAVRAASIMFYGISRQDIRARTTAHYWYEVSLSSHRNQLQGLAGHDGQTMISGLISCSLVLALFEVISSTEPSGSFHHYAAAATLLEMVGPTNCQSGMMHQMFRTIRLNAVSQHISSSWLLADPPCFRHISP